jgi:hypothetical protein
MRVCMSVSVCHCVYVRGGLAFVDVAVLACDLCSVLYTMCGVC